MGPPAPEAPASGARPEPAYFLRPVWSCADVPTLPIMPHFLGAIYQATAAPAQPHQVGPSPHVQAMPAKIQQGSLSLWLCVWFDGLQVAWATRHDHVAHGSQVELMSINGLHARPSQPILEPRQNMASAFERFKLHQKDLDWYDLTLAVSRCGRHD